MIRNVFLASTGLFALTIVEFSLDSSEPHEDKSEIHAIRKVNRSEKVRVFSKGFMVFFVLL
jgi:hypothetical protein